MRTNQHKTFVFIPLAVILGFLLTLILVETGLWLAQSSYFYLQNLRNRAGLSKEDNIRILCIGESTTALGGEHSYPSQLQKQLDSRNPSRRFTVINQGIPGTGLGHIMSQADQWLDDYTPHVVIAMMGINENRQRLPLNEIFPEARHPLRNLKTFKMLMWLSSSFSRKLMSLRKKSNPLTPDTPAKSSPLSPESEKPANSESETWQLLALVDQYIAQEKFTNAIKILLLIHHDKIGVNLGDPVQQRLNTIFLLTDDYTHAAEFARSLLIENPANYNMFELVLNSCKTAGAPPMITMIERLITEQPSETIYYDLLANCYEFSGSLQKANPLRIHAENLFKNSAQKNVIQHYLSLIKKTRARNIKLIIMEYPTRPILPLKNALSLQTSVNDVLFVENLKNFQDARTRYSYDDLFTDHFGGTFGHATDLGNRLIAENLADLILNEVESLAQGRTTP